MNTDTHTLSGAYALDALSPEEAAQFREHLAQCQACCDEVRELREAAARMGAAESMAPPPALKGKVMAAAGRIPQQPPSTAGKAAERARRRWPTLLAAAASVIALVGVGAVGIRAFDGNDGSQLAAAAADVFSADDVRSATVETANGGVITVGVSASRKEMAVDTRKLPALDSGHDYQVWSVRDGRMLSEAILSDARSGAAMGLPSEGTQVAVTVEPSGGSEQPTTEPIVVVDPASI